MSIKRNLKVFGEAWTRGKSYTIKDATGNIANDESSTQNETLNKLVSNNRTVQSHATQNDSFITLEQNKQ